ncbi:MAG: exodeoxyribonuclease VII small subunit [Proteobacteria bacterium]|nr:exodeoxyribonuclease VII small subunit [Verrucomicrobiota bacterium]NBU11553.1 exodeoxyribonuclease VII small subunit [Pseudomonadota bacterium]
MSKAAQSSAATSPVADLPFEEALAKLEAIVEAMEAQDMPLESLLTRYAEGTQLAAVCQRKLAEAEVKVLQLEKKTSGEFNLTPVAVGTAD